MGVCEAYNIGIGQAHFPYLCFSHDDITFDTNHWGEILINDFERDSESGLIGIAGSAYKSWVLSGWHTSQPVPTRFLAENVIHAGAPVATRYLTNSTGNNLVQVASVDGCFMFSSKNRMAHIRFDEDSFKSYHCYDIDLSLQVNQKFKVFVSFNVLLSHYSEGNFDEKWFGETVKLHKKWNKTLPCIIGDATQEEIAREEESAFYGIVSAACAMNKYYVDVAKIFFSRKYIKLIGPKAWLRSAYKSRKIYRMYRQCSL